jgi:hypothetical protein
MPRTPNKLKGGRLNLEMGQEVRGRMEELKNETGARSLADVVSRALAIYDFIWKQKRAGVKILIQDNEGTRELVIL